jgi:hypothetical protein
MIPPYVFSHKAPDLVLPVTRVTRQMVEKNVICARTVRTHMKQVK